MNTKISDFLRRVTLSEGTSIGLKEDALDLLLESAKSGESTSVIQDFDEVRKGNVLRKFKITATQHEEMQSIIDGGKKIPAIKIFRELANCGLKEAKDAVENDLFFRQNSLASFIST